jgi:hypothetical protein
VDMGGGGGGGGRLQTSTSMAVPLGASSGQPEPHPKAQSEGVANEGSSIDVSLPMALAHCQRTPRSAGYEPRRLPRAAVGVGRVGASASGRE